MDLDKIRKGFLPGYLQNTCKDTHTHTRTQIYRRCRLRARNNRSNKNFKIDWILSRHWGNTKSGVDKRTWNHRQQQQQQQPNEIGKVDVACCTVECIHFKIDILGSSRTLSCDFIEKYAQNTGAQRQPLWTQVIRMDGSQQKVKKKWKKIKLIETKLDRIKIIKGIESEKRATLHTAIGCCLLDCCKRFVIFCGLVI